MSHPPEEILQAHSRYVEARESVLRGEKPWSALADFFTDDAVFIDPAWGRVEGIENIRRFLVESMAGLEDWRFPREWTAVDGNVLLSCFQNRLPGARTDGTPYQAPGVSIMTYAGNGKFSREEDILNMAHVTELMRESGWKPGPGLNVPPPNPRR